MELGERLATAQMWRCDGCGYVNVDTGRCLMCNSARAMTVATTEVFRAPAAEPSEPVVLTERPAGPLFHAPPAVLLVVLAMIVGNAVYQNGLVHLLHGRTRTVALFASLLCGFLFYLVNWAVASGVARRVRLTPRTGRSVATSVAAGALVGGCAAALGALLVSSSQGHAALDPTAAILVDDGGWVAFAIGVLVIAVVAPLVEEYIFRGLLAESLAPHGRRLALWVSAAGFAAAHLSPVRFPYYLAMGLLLGRLYLRRGIWASITAHAVFNGAVLLTAVIVLTVGSSTIKTHGLQVTMPAGWHSIAPPPLDDYAAAGPDGALLEIAHGTAPPGIAVNAADVLRGIQQSRTIGNATIMGATAITRETRAGLTVVADVGSSTEASALAVILTGSTIHIIVVHEHPGSDPHPVLDQLLDSARAA